jgi:DNA-binding NarL/FixJ family response regulator
MLLDAPTASPQGLFIFRGIMNNRTLKLLLVDDSALVLERLVALLEDWPDLRIVGQARDVGEAIAALSESEPDVVILDIRMPGGNGLDVLRSIKSRLPLLPVIMLTNYPYKQYRRKAMADGADYFFDKSTEFEKVKDALRAVAELI